MAVERMEATGKLADSPNDGQDSQILHVGERQKRAPDGYTTIVWNEPIGIVTPTRPIVGMNWHHVSVGPGGGGVALHQHHKDHAIWYIMSGKGRADIGSQMGERQEEVGPGDIVDAPIGGYHYIENIGDDELVILEVIMRSADYVDDGPVINPVEVDTFDTERYGGPRGFEYAGN
ncbi:MAG: cupin domain-containing protein [Chloroflexi bacterium]|nr:cupin domain-containing protein [Chloroflexota bacterium]